MAWGLAGEVGKTSTPLSGVYSTQAPKQRAIQLVIEAATLRAKSLAALRCALKYASATARPYIEVGADSGVAPTGGRSVDFLRQYLESVAGRGRTAPGAATDSPALCSDALGIV